MGKKRGHIPIRTCVCCRIRCNKKDLIRLVLNVKGDVVRDKSGKGQGRGAYVCGREECWAGLKAGKVLARAFKRKDPLLVHSRLSSRLTPAPVGLCSLLV